MKDLHIHIENGPCTKEWIEKFIYKAEKENLDEICLLEHSIRFKDFYPTFKEAREYNLYQKRWVEGKKSSAYTLDEFIPHLREGNRKTQAIEALRFLLFIKVPEVFGDCISL